MFEFFRRYQKAFLAGVTAMIVVSFVFFGALGTFMAEDKTEDRVLGKAIDGSEMSLLEMRALSRFLASDRDDFAQPNLFNDGVVRHDLLATKVAESIVERSLPLLKEGLAVTLQRVRAYKGYEHPEAPFLSMKAVWEKAAPRINREWTELKEIQEPTLKAFTHLSNLYQFQSSIPPEWLRRILSMQEQQVSGIHPDPRLQHEDLVMFGFHSLSDWFGKNFIDLMAQFIHNGAIAARLRGYEVTPSEAKADLRRIFADSVQKKNLQQVGYQDALRMIGMHENEAVSVWQKVLLVRRYFNDMGRSAFMDRLPYEEFARVADETTKMDLYRWPLAASMKTGADALALDTYLDAVGARKEKDLIDFPKEFLSVDQVAEKYPELIATLYTAKVSAIDKREAALRAPLKELWDFETLETSWKRLAKEFPVLQAVAAGSVEERFQSLEEIDPKVRGKIDLFARRLLIDGHPEWLDEALRGAKSEEKELILSAGKIQLAHVQDPKRLGSLFEQILASPESALAELQCFQSGDAVFRFENIAKISDRMIKTFDEAKKDGSLDMLVRRRSDGTEAAALTLMAPLKKAVEKKGEKSPFAIGRLAIIAENAKEDLKKNRMDPRWVRSSEETAFAAQFKWEHSELEVSRTTQEDWMIHDAFSLGPQQGSSIHVPADGRIAFFFVKERQKAAEPIFESLNFGHEVIAADVQRLLAERLFDSMVGANAIVIPTEKE
jgi:hypothetical protein